MLLVDDGEPEVAKDNAFLKQGMGSDHNIDAAFRQQGEGFSARGSRVAAGEERQSEPGGLAERRESLMMLAGQNFGRRHQRRLPPGLDDRRHGKQSDQRLAGSDIALQKPQHAGWRAKICGDFGHRGRLGCGEREGQGGGDLLSDPAITLARAAGGAPDFRAHQGKRQLRGEQFIVCEPYPRRRLRRNALRCVRAMHFPQGLGKSRKGRNI